VRPSRVLALPEDTDRLGARIANQLCEYLGLMERS